MKHINKKYGSFATPCKRCDLPFVWQTPIARISWAGLPCKNTRYTPTEQFAINKAWIAAT